MVVPELRKRYSIDEYEELGRRNILKEDDRVELIEGEIVKMTPVGTHHMACVKRLNQIFSKKSWAERIGFFQPF